MRTISKFFRLARTVLGALPVIGFLIAGGTASAAYNCSISSGGFAAAYLPSAPTANITQTSATIRCTRATSDPTTMNYWALANNGQYPAGSQNQAAFGANRINYDVYRDGACGSQWTGFTFIGGTLNFGGSLSASITIDYWGCIPAGQTGKPAGTYTDSITISLYYGPFTLTTTIAPVSIYTPATCNLTTAPSNIVFNYAAFAGAANASTSFGVTCTSTLPYTLALDATSGTLLGLGYTLALSAPGGSGTGVQQLYTISGTIPGGQAGTCATGTCTASQPRVLTITY